MKIIELYTCEWRERIMTEDELQGRVSERLERRELLKTHTECTTIHFKCSKECNYKHSVTIPIQFKRKPSKRKLYTQVKGIGTMCKKCERIIDIKFENILDFERCYIPKGVYC